MLLVSVQVAGQGIVRRGQLWLIFPLTVHKGKILSVPLSKQPSSGRRVAYLRCFERHSMAFVAEQGVATSVEGFWNDAQSRGKANLSKTCPRPTVLRESLDPFV